MRTRTSESKMSDVNEDNSKNVRMSLHVLQPAATDKENLVGPGRSAPLCTERGKSIIEHEKKFLDNSSKSIKKKKHAKFNIGESSKKTVTANDLTSDAPSEIYWKQLAEKRREALEEALKENDVLCQRIEVLEEENALTKQMLKEAQDLIEVLNEILDDPDKTHQSKINESTAVNVSDGGDSDS